LSSQVTAFVSNRVSRALRNKTTVAGVVLTGAVLLVAAMFWPSHGASEISVPQAAVLGAVEGLTEYLPISSTGHLILASHAMGLSEFGARSGLLGRDVVKSPAVSAFEIVIQIGAIMAVLGLYRWRVRQMAMGLLGRNAQGLRLVKLLVVGALPAMAVGLALHETIQELQGRLLVEGPAGHHSGSGPYHTHGHGESPGHTHH